MSRRAHLLLTLLVALTGTTVVSGVPAQAGEIAGVAPPTPAPVTGAADEVDRAISTNGTARVIITLGTPSGDTTPTSWSGVVDRLLDIRDDQNELAAALADTGSTIHTDLTIIPASIATIDAAGLAELRADPDVVAIRLDEAVPVVLDDTVPHIGADTLHAATPTPITGTGTAVAIIDTGIDTDHPMFSDGASGSRIVSEACYSAPASADEFSLCPQPASGSVTSAIGPGAAEDCPTSVTGCGHGTHVAGIAAGSNAAGGSNLDGVAPDADIIAINVFTRFTASADCSPSAAPCVLSYTSAQLQALQRVEQLSSTHDIAAVNMSLGGGEYSTSCDSTTPLTAAINRLRGLGIAVVIASGNDSLSNGVGRPACISGAIAVGSTTGGKTATEMVSSFTNTHPTLIDLYAPGSSIVSSVPGGGVSTKSGTSMAAPHVAGAFALMRQARPDWSVNQILAALQTTGTDISVRYNALDPNGTDLGFAHPRVNVDLAVGSSVNLLDVTAIGNGTGSVTSDTGAIDCGTTCSASVAPGSTHVLAATGTDGSTFAGWTGACSGTGTCTVTVNSATRVGAEFTITRPVNDSAASPVVITALPHSGTGSNVNATTEPGESVGCSIGASTWFTWTAPISTTATVSLAGSTFDTVLGIVADNPLYSPVVGCNDDATFDGVSSTRSRLTFDASAGTTYYLQVGGWAGASGAPTTGTIALGITATHYAANLQPGANGGLRLDSNSTCTTTCAVAVTAGASATVTAVPDSGYTLDQWTGACSGTVGPVCTTTVTADTVVGAAFVAGHTLTVGITGSGFVTVDDGTTQTVCSSDCAVIVPDSSTVNVTASPTVGWALTGVTGACANAGMPCSLVPVADSQTTVTFSELVTLTVDRRGGALGTIRDEGGEIRCAPADPTCSGVPLPTTYPYGLRAESTSDAVFVAWSDNCTPRADPQVCDITIAADTTVTAWFRSTSTPTVPSGAVVAGLTESPDVIDDATPVVGETITVTIPAGTFYPYERVVLTLHSDPVVLADVDAAADGSLTTQVTVPTDVASGVHSLVALGQDSGAGVRSSITVSATVTAQVFTPLTPVRLLDTRSSGSWVGSLDGSGSALTLQVAGRGGVPVDGVAAVALNVTVVDGLANDFGGFVTVYPCDVGRPDASNLNFISGQTVPNAVVAPLSATGSVCLYVYGSAHLLVDVSGFFTSGFSPVTPVRMTDTRSSGSRVGSLDGSGSALEVQIAGRGGVPVDGVAAVALNVTVVDGRANDFGGFVTVYPCGTRPDASNLNFISGQTVPNAVIAPLSGDGRVCLYVYGSAHLLVDVSGFFESGFSPVTPSRLLDSRATGSRIGELDGSGRAVEVQVTGRAGVPVGATAAALNVTVVDGRANDFGGFVTVFPCGTRPDASNLNFISGQTVPNAVIAPLSSTGSVCLYVYGTAHLLVDISGHL